MGNCAITCLKCSASLWLLHPIHQSMGMECFRWHFKPFSTPELTLIEFIHVSLAFLSGVISRSLKNFSSADILFTVDMWVAATLLIGIKPIKCSVTSPFIINVAYNASCSNDVMSWILSQEKVNLLPSMLEWSDLINKFGWIMFVLTNIFWRYIRHVFRWHY